MYYRTIDHTADFGIEVFGKDLFVLFANAARALFDLLVAGSAIPYGPSVTMIVAGYDLPDLMVNWLRELLYMWTGNNRLLISAQVRDISDVRLSAACRFGGFDPNGQVLKHDIKAVTYHKIAVDAVAGGWKATIIFDV